MTVEDATWVADYVIRIRFRDQTVQHVDFGPYLAKHSHPYIDPYKNLDQFKAFRVDQGNLVWGEDWDMIFPNHKLYRGNI